MWGEFAVGQAHAIVGFSEHVDHFDCLATREVANAMQCFVRINGISNSLR